MAGLATEGFRAQLPLVPTIPENLGKVDVKSIYDRVVQGLQTGDAIRTEGARQKVDDEQLKLAAQQAQAGQAALPSATAAQIGQSGAQLAQSNVLAQQNSPAVAAKSGALASDRLDTLLADTNFQNTLSPQQRVILASKGVPTTSSGTVERTPSGQTVVTQKTTSDLGGQVLPISTATETSPTNPLLTPITGQGGQPLGTVVSSVGPDGKPQTHVAVAPIGALNQINTGTTYQKIGERRDDLGNVKEIYQAFTTTAAGGAPKPTGAPVEVNQGSAPPGSQGASALPIQPFISKDAGKAIEDAQAELQTIQGRKVELENITNASERFINSGLSSGRFIGPLRGFLGDSAAQEFTGSVQNALSTALQPLRGTGRVSNTEFNQALSALPRDTDQAGTIRSKMQYLNLVTDWGIARQQAILDNLGKGLNRYQAFQKAINETPIPPVPDFYTANANGGTPVAHAVAAPVAQPHPQDAAAIEYAKAHPEDPRSAAILKANGL